MPEKKKPNRGNSLVTHPYRSWFDEQIMNGRSITYIHGSQTAVVPPELVVSKRTISEYKNNIMKPNKEVIKVYQEEMQKKEEEEAHQEIIQEPDVQQYIQEKASAMIDAKDNFVTMQDHLMRQIQILAEIEDPTTRNKIDIAATVGDLIDKWRLQTMDFLKAEGKLLDSPHTQINIVNIEQKNAEMTALKDTVVGIIQELDPSAVPKFYQMLKDRTKPIKESYENKQKMIMGGSNNLSEHSASQVVNKFDALGGQMAVPSNEEPEDE